MKKTAVFWTFFIVSMSVANAALTSKGYVDTGLGKKQDALVNSDTITVGADNKLTAVTATATKAGVATLGTIPVGETGTTTAKISVE